MADRAFNIRPSGPWPADSELVIRRRFAAPVAKVWEMWTTSAHVARWWGPEGFTAPVCDFEPEVGRPWLIHMRGPDGHIYHAKGVFTDVVHHQRIAFTDVVDPDDDTWPGTPPPDCIQIITFEAVPGGTQLTITIRVEDEAARDEMAGHGVENGWLSSLGRLEAEL